MLQLGRYELMSIRTGFVRLDGGAMFGVVPKVLWENVADVDEFNRILLATRTLIAIDRAAERIVLVDTGCGTKWTEKGIERFGVVYDRNAIPSALEAEGLSVEQITDIVITHLHFDHNGGLTDWFDDPGGPTTLRYPKARHWIHKKHWEHANEPHFKDRASFLKEDFTALADADVLSFVDGENTEGPFQDDGPFQDMGWYVSHGHTPYQLHPVFSGGGKRLLFVGDIAPTVPHLRLGWVMAYDLAPLETIAEKRAIFEICMNEGMLLAFPHDPETGGVAITGKADRPIVTETLPL